MALIDSILLFNKAYDVARPYGDGCERGLTLGDLAKLLDSMPEVEPERKPGHKINQHQYPAKWVCSECGARHFDFSDNFCSKCGADVRGEQDG